MNATRAATIRLRSSFDGAVSLGRVQTPTLAIIARREEEIRAFKPEPYWLVDAHVRAQGRRARAAATAGRFYAGSQPRLKTAEEAEAIVAAVRGQDGEITKLETTKRSEKAPLLYDLTSLQREANTRFGFSARRTLAAAQRLYEEHKALTYPRTNSRFLPSDMGGEIKPIAELVGKHRDYAKAAEYVTGLDVLPTGRVINDAKVTDHHAIIPTRSEHKRRQDERRRPPRLRHGRRGASWPSSTPRPCSRTRAWRPRSPSTSSAPAAACCCRPAGAASTARRRSSPARVLRRRRRGRPRSRCPSSSAARPSPRARSPRRRRSPSRRAATATRRCWARWRPPASWSTTTSCARR